MTHTLYTPTLAKIKRIEKMTDTETLFEIELAGGKKLDHTAGQFVEVSVFGIGEAPISVTSSQERMKNFELVVRKVGDVTNAMHNMNVGDTLGIRGPFGTSFNLPELKGMDLLFVAGGIGLVPLRSYIHHTMDHKSDYGRQIIFFGARSPKERLFVNELEEWKSIEGIEYFETVDRGDESWKGNVGVITTLFPKIEINPANTACIICGPPVMYKFVLMEAKKKGIPEKNIVMSLERRMKCGVGKCGHCQINSKYCCQEGAVFKYPEIAPLPEAI